MSSQPISGTFFGLDAGWLASTLTTFQNGLLYIASGGQEYTISGRTFRRGDLPEMRQTIAELKQALDRANGVRNTSAYPMFTGPYSS